MDRFVVGSGRCGSTLLSLMLARHPRVLNLSEFFNGLDVGRRFVPERFSGREFADLVGAQQDVVTAVVRRGYRVSEVVYPFDAPSSRYGREDRVPWLLITLLPRLTDRPDDLYDELISQTVDFPNRLLVDQYRGLFEWLGQRLGRECWIERSGSSIHYFGSLRACFPEARFVHLHRSGPEVALSMREHHAYRLPISLLYDAPLGDGTHALDQGPLDFGASPQDGDAISRILASRPPPEYFGRYWADQIQVGLAAMEGLGPDQLKTVRFEDLVAKPRETVEQIADFFDLPVAPSGFFDEARDLVTGIPAARLESLRAVEKAALRKACEPAEELLRSR